MSNRRKFDRAAAFAALKYVGITVAVVVVVLGILAVLGGLFGLFGVICGVAFYLLVALWWLEYLKRTE